MKTFKKNVAIIFVLQLLLVSLLSTNVCATEVQQKENTLEATDLANNPIYGLDAFVRNCKEVNVREEPNDKSNIICTIPLDEHLTVVDETGKWFQIKYGDITGYVFWKYIKFTEPDIGLSNNLIGSSIIHYTSSSNRDTNISIACNIINGTILNPNESFVWSKVVGKTTSAKGFLEAPVIINRKSAMGLGGGVCQVSTTLYNALLDTSITPDELHKHSIGSAYSDKDATVAFGSKDFAFTNSYTFPIYIEMYSYKSVIFANIYKVE